MRHFLRFLLLLVLATGSAFAAFAANAFSGQPVTVDTVRAADLPREARRTLDLIRQGGPFPYERDGVVFGNFEKRLPREARGYYREYTVPTPGERTRGARRIIAGGNPPQVFYYTDDHYRTFRRIEE